MSDKTVLVLGGGVGGIVAARRLRRLLPASHRIRLIERAAQHVFQPSLLWLMIGEREPGRIQRPLEPLNRKGIEVERGVIEEIDAAGRAVRVGGRELVADALIVSLGADLVPGAVPGLAEAGYNLYSLEGAVALRDARSRVNQATADHLVEIGEHSLYRFLRLHDLHDQRQIERQAEDLLGMYRARLRTRRRHAAPLRQPSPSRAVAR